jgi:S-adenosylmethionine synthetase
MISVSEAVLPGHPDKFCDLVADTVVDAVCASDNLNYAQIEVAVWSDQMWISGAAASANALNLDLQALVVKAGTSIGLGPHNWIDPARYKISSSVCQLVEDPRKWTEHVNDQSIVVGWAGYDALVDYLPPEHFLARTLAKALFDACLNGSLKGHGPDGKVLVRIREDGGQFHIEQLLVTLQQQRDADFMAFDQALIRTLRLAIASLQARDPRWVTPFAAIDLLTNPNGPMRQAGSDGDNGQTGRKLAVDFYGPRIPIGGGALAGKHWTHIDRLGAAAARLAAIKAVRSGAEQCQVRLAYAPNRSEPLDVHYTLTGKGLQLPAEEFSHAALRTQLGHRAILGGVQNLATFAGA